MRGLAALFGRREIRGLSARQHESTCRLCVVLTGLALANIGCGGHSGELKEDLRITYEPFDQKLRFELTAPLIVLGDVQSVSEVGHARPSAVEPRIGVQLTRVTIRVEEIIKGPLRTDELSFLYYKFSPEASRVDLGKPRYSPRSGQRRIFFLKPSGEMYRSIADVIDYTLRVSSGTHGRGFCSGKSPGRCIAELLIIPQRDVDIEQFAGDLVDSEYIAEVLCSRTAAENFLRALMVYPDRRVSERAREVLSGTQPQ
jgi:hypothetical protein